jgi:predicted short-subunit dehydrogenase-like oxidoreductase (DUF2520 family)
MRKSLAIVGAGRVGSSLGRSLHELSWEIGAVVTRNEASARRAARFIGAGKPCAGMTRRILESPLILIATPDRAIAEVAQVLARIGGEELRGKIVLHTSGALESSVLKAANDLGAETGSMHPLQSFTGVGVMSLRGTVFAVEGTAIAVRAARQIARSLGGTPVKIAGQKKATYHAAAALAAGHLLALEEAAMRVMMSAGMKRREALRGLLPLTRQVLDNLERFGPKASWTGPLSRGDFGVVSEHWAALAALPPEFSETYEAVSKLASHLFAEDAALMSRELAEIFRKKKAKARKMGETP